MFSFYKALIFLNELAVNYFRNFTTASIMAAMATRSVSQAASRAREAIERKQFQPLPEMDRRRNGLNNA